MSANDVEEGANCINLTYDILTIFISIADIVTDVIVLISFYNKERTAFFAISLVILIIAQLCYAVLFIWRYKPRMSDSKIIFLFLALLPFGTIVSFLVYFTDDTDSAFAKWFGKQFPSLKVQESLEHRYENDKHGKMTKWIIRKLSKVCQIHRLQSYMSEIVFVCL